MNERKWPWDHIIIHPTKTKALWLLEIGSLCLFFCLRFGRGGNWRFRESQWKSNFCTKKNIQMNFPMAKSTNRPHQQAGANKRAFLPGTNEMIPFGHHFFGWVISRVEICSNCHHRNYRVFLPFSRIAHGKNHVFFWCKNSDPPMNRAVGKKQKTIMVHWWKPFWNTNSGGLSAQTEFCRSSGFLQGWQFFRGWIIISELLELLWPPSPYVENPTFPLTSVEWRKFRKDEIEA